MHRAIFAVLIALFVLIPFTAAGQTTAAPNGEGYLHFAPGGRLGGSLAYMEPSLHFGAGGE